MVTTAIHPESSHPQPLPNPDLEKIWQGIQTIGQQIQEAQSPLALSALQQLDQDVARMAGYAEQTGRAALPYLEKAREIARFACEQRQLPPMAWSLLHLAQESQERSDLNQAIALLGKVIDLCGAEAPGFVRKTLANLHVARAHHLLASMNVNANALAKVHAKEAMLHYSQWHWVQEDLVLGKRYDPRNGDIEKKLADIKLLVQRLDAMAKENRIAVKPRAGSAEKCLPVLTIAKDPVATQRKIQGSSFFLLLVVGGLWGGLAFFGMPAWLVTLGQEYGVSLDSPPTEQAVAGVVNMQQAAPAGEQEFGMAMPAPRDGITMDEAMKKIEKLGVKVPTGDAPAGQALPPTAAGAPSDDQEFGMAIPAPRDGITMGEAMKKIEQMGVKIPGDPMVQAGQAPPPADDQEFGMAIPAPRDGISVQEAMKKVEQMGLKIPGQGPMAAAPSPVPAGQTVRPPPVAETAPVQAVAAVAAPPVKPVSTPTPSTSTVQLPSLALDSPVKVTLANGKTLLGRWGETVRGQVEIWPAGGKKANTQPTLLAADEILQVDEVAELDLYQGIKVEVRRKDGTSQTGTITSYDDKAIQLSQRSKFGVMKFVIPRHAILAIDMATVQEKAP